MSQMALAEGVRIPRVAVRAAERRGLAVAQAVWLGSSISALRLDNYEIYTTRATAGPVRATNRVLAAASST